MEDKTNNSSYFSSLLEKYISEENGKNIQIEPIQICSYLDENFYNESYLKNTEALKEQLKKEKEIIINLIERLNNKLSLNKLFNESSMSMNQLVDLSDKRKVVSSDLEKQFQQTSIDNLIKYTKLINQLTRIKKYFQILLIINSFYTKVKFCIKNDLLSLSLKPFINLIELQNNLNNLKVPSGPKLINNEYEITDQIFPHLTKVVDHVVGDTLSILEKKMKQALNQSLKDINWLSLTNSAIGSSSTSTSSTAIESNEELIKQINNEKDQQQQEILNNKLKTRNNFIKNFTNLILLQLAVQKYNSKIKNNDEKDQLNNDSNSINNNNNEANINNTNENINNTEINENINNNENNEEQATITSSPNQDENKNKKQEKTNNDYTKLWAINIILLPIVRGFKYHFQSDRVTNFIEKPEWAIHYIKKIIREYSKYLCLLQDELENNNVYYIDVHQWFISGLVETVKNKFRSEIKLFLQRPDHYKRYFYHTMEQIVDLQRFLLEEYAYPNSIEFGNVKGGIEMGLINDVDKIPVPFSIFQEKEIFNSWLELEIENCDQHFQALYNNEERFQLYYRDEFPDLDQLKPTNSAYELISILASLTERYQLLTDVNSQFEFFIKIQINLLLRYKNELKTVISILLSDGDQNLKELCYLFNSLNYIIKVLQDWDNELIFIEIYEYMNKNQSSLLNDENYSTLSNSLANKEDEDYSAFSVMISDYKQLLKSLKKKLVKDLFINFISKIGSYLKRGTFSNQIISGTSGSGSSISSYSKNIFSFSNFNKQKSKLFNDQPSNQQNNQENNEDENKNNNDEKDNDKSDNKQDKKDSNNTNNTNNNNNNRIINSEDYAQFDVSNEISNGLSSLRYQLGIIYRSLTPTKQPSVWKRLLIKIDKYLFDLLLNYQPKFTENDGKQFSKDIKTLLLIFNSFSNSPENYMKKIIESTILLRLSNQEFNQFKDDFTNKLKVNLEEELLQKYQIYNLSNDQINTLLKLRI
ncbi:hypothetical protein DICPUDRAFT_38166 [Dictyostelium purpureum]|uniref:Uncharacterized protein n=1 Tax=Dictyostelium purpureum TaxID=5786 RepID=F0ZTZ2_DICPU|nr:uncharacterized protein DICPUDRAFT_38166 [Dictyostelium purpureum]EGC32587.1 hypothetical protein DICPUDRAFT_38166 [Dictyostelium purpureum]|eukprot:XP_003290878.1 hypothetical protein DICPUDRAFT_38166 [Dictyostelium purpureum]